jgi:hypothetical protein
VFLNFKPISYNIEHNMKAVSKHIHFYKQSLNLADKEVRVRVETHGTALKDVVGAAFENHRKRIWEYFGCTVSKERFGAMFDVDWSIKYCDRLIAFEEDKGHYVDSCFAERAIVGFTKTVNKFLKESNEIPVLILHSFTRYSKFNEKLEEDMDTRKPEIVNELKKKLVYNTLVSRGRLPKTKWFNHNEKRFDCYSSNVEDKLIIEDIVFIQSLILDSQ